MRKTVFVVVTFFMLFFFMQQVLNPIWISLNSQVSALKPINSSGRLIRYLKLQNENMEDSIEDGLDERDDVPEGYDENILVNFDEEGEIKRQYIDENNEEIPKQRDLIYVKNDDEEDDENERLRKSPYIVHEDEEEKLLSSPPQMSDVKLISEWKLPTPFHNNFKVCRYNKCEWVKDNTIADAVLFRASSVRNWVIKPFRRKPGQRWVLYTADPAVKMYNFDRKDVGSNFNATSTYQLHSDYPRIFGRLQKIKLPSLDFEKIFDGKKKQVAWFVSHCRTWSKRELYVERMRKIIPVDIFGACGNFTCEGEHQTKSNDKEVCLPMLNEQYKFYLSFENSFCQDYVSEKFFKLFQDVNIIPVVQGGFDYKKNLPSNIFIDSSDFKTPEDLARYMLELGEDKDRYVRMLKRKATWTYKGVERRHCVICEGLHKDTRKQHFYPDLFAAFNGRPSECHPPKWLEEQSLERSQ
ncbi:hypothetical protein RRG08_053131 [Elysia crispata]|uniref:Fucosyltransferase n=1 Tax=Elysia crispata TaxID=231223 RepID=A0AAE1DZA8_9GAST|nr:hypothetical protein RRG08_053131 [Elysia crispata]